MSEEKTFNQPKSVAINRVYTRKGDAGQTRLAGGQRVDKHDARVEAYGTVDELNCFVGAARQTIAEASSPASELSWLDGVLSRVQHELFNLGSLVATLPDDVMTRQPQIRLEDVSRLEREIDQCNESLPPLRSFVLPGAGRLNADLHICRTVCRRAERLCAQLASQGGVEAAMAYLNRLSDAFFVWSRWVVVVQGLHERLWDPNAGEPETS